MSLSRDSAREIAVHIKDNCTALFGQKFWECREVYNVQLVVKADRTESRFLAISKFRIFFVYGKNPVSVKVDKCINLLALRSIQVNTHKELNLSWEDRGKSVSVVLRTAAEDGDVLDIARGILTALKHYFPDIEKSLSNFLCISPEHLLSTFSSLPSSTPDLPCHNFRRSYVAICDFLDQPYKDEVVWDVERIYFIHNVHEIRLDDFTHLTTKDQIAVIGCAQFSSYFNGITIDGTKLSPEHIDIILKVVRQSHALTSLKLVNCGLPKDFIALLASALQHNVEIPLRTIDLSSNHFDDKKAFASLASVLPRLGSLKEIVLSDCGLTEKSIHFLSSGLYMGLTIDNSVGQKFQLHSLVLAKNALKDDINELVNFVSLCNTLRVLDLSSTGVYIDKLWSALKLGGLELEELLLSGCLTSKKSRDHIQLVKELFSCMVNLKRLDLSRTPTGPEVLQSILAGLSSNQHISNFHLALDGVCEKSCVDVLDQYLPQCSIANLSLRDNGLEQDASKLFGAMREMPQLTHLDIGGNNFAHLRGHKKHSSTLGKVLGDLVKLISSDTCPIKHLIVSDCRLGSSLSVLLNALGVTTLEHLDISNNEIGNFGARLLSKALQLNTSLKTIAMDRNQITADGFADIARALELNQSLTSIAYPVHDITEAMSRPDRPKLLSSLEGIDILLKRNRSSPSVSELCCEKVLHSLNNNCDSYGINNSDDKKVFFHALTRIISESSEENAAGKRIKGIVENLSSQLSVVANEQTSEALQRIRSSLAKCNIEIEAFDTSSSHFNTNDAKFKKSAKELLSGHLAEVVWDCIFQELDAFLKSSKRIEVKGSVASTVIDRSVHTQLPRSFRPNSTVIDGLQSPFGDCNEELGVGDRPVGSPLTHLAKSRPRPARNQKRNIVKEDTKISEEPLNLMTASIHSSSTADSSPRLREAWATEPTISPPSPRLASSMSTPPPPVPRRNKVGSVPPKLPPKPDSPAKSPIDLRNHKTRVLPAFEGQTQKEEDSDTD